MSEPARGHADALALEIGDGLDRRVGGQREREIRRRPVHRGDADRQRALGAEAQAWTRAETDIEAAGGEPLLELRIAAKCRHLDLEAFLLENLGFGSDFGGAEGEGIGNGLAEANLVERVGRADRSDSVDRRQHAYGNTVPHRRRT